MKFEDSIEEFNNISDFNKVLTSALIRNRLSIVDLSKNGHQPMCLNDQNTWITYNGEIYNYIELKNELIMGYILLTQKLIRRLFYPYKEWGNNCVKNLMECTGLCNS